MRKKILLVSVFAFLVSVSAVAQTPGPDLLTLSSGEKLTGQFEHSDGDTLTFKSDTLGEITVKWTTVQELHTSGRFAVVQKTFKLTRHLDVNTVPQGTIAVTNQQMTVTPTGAPSQTIAVSDADHIVSQPEFLNAVQHAPRWTEGWKGAATLGASLVNATQKSISISSAAGLVRAVPSETWLAPRSRTIVDFNSSYGKVTQPNTPTLKTSIFHADAEQDEYFTPKFYGLGQASFDHSFSQGLNLQQIYGLGVGYSVLKDTNQTLDVQASINFERQSFEDPIDNKNLVSSIFSETYNRKLAGGITLKEQIAVDPAWNDTRAYSASGSLLLSMPLYQRFSFTVGVLDAFLNDPPAGFLKNSFQFTTGLTYTFK